MKIIQFHSENFKRIKVVDITPDGYVQIISGLNENGKSSILDAIWTTLQYKAGKKSNPEPVRAGEAEAVTILDLGDYIVTRCIKANGSTTLKITTPDGNIVPSPQKLLDGLIGDLSFDPWEFANMKEQDQRDTLADVVFNISNGQTDLAEYDRKRKVAYDKRTQIKKDKIRIENSLRNIAPPTQQDPQEELSAVYVAEKLRTTLSENTEFDRRTENLKLLQETIDRLQRELEEARNAAQRERIALSKLRQIDPEPLKTQLAGLEKANKRAREVQEYKKLQKQLKDVNQEIEDLNDEMELLDINKAEALENCPLPVKGFTITENGIMVMNEEGKWVPFTQASAARKLRISLAIAMASNPELRVIRITDGSVLDDKSIEIIDEMARDKDFQIWVEYASRNSKDKVGVYIEDGKVAN
jgi:hypothetical protein